MKEVGFSPRIEKALKLNYKKGIDKLLDVGCGDGGFSMVLKDVMGAKEVYGIELMEEAVKFARQRGVNVIQSDLNKNGFPYKDNFFEAVFAGEIIEHMLSPDKFLEEIYRILKVGGHLIITTPNIACWHCRIHLLFGKQPYFIPISLQHRGVGAFMAKFRDKKSKMPKYISSSARVRSVGLRHVQFFTLGGLCDLMKENGFDVVETRGAPSDELTFQLPFLLWKVIRLVENVFAFIPSWASGVIICGVKK